ncbi:YybH family protein [Sphingomonas fuzhouensis]|uniref:YybH family protein n=1 Tax=Sphingomonas fuzhouensis TaxID=3106033 RepID=UPI002AFEECA8|nr:nuclear transport factor 2 family protein [Sphingomonas sp. SGZ-02]
MRGLTIAAAFALSPMAVHAAAPVTDPAAAGIRAAMLDSAAAWNAGDLNRFVAIYAPDAVFVGRNGLVQGRAAIADRYRKSFTDGGNSRGQLRFDFLELKRIGDRRILFARWNLSGGTSDESGMTTLVFEHRADGWKIVADHSS